MGGAWGRAAIGALIVGALLGMVAIASAEETPQVTRDDLACASLGPKRPGYDTDASFSRFRAILNAWESCASSSRTVAGAAPSRRRLCA